MLANPPPEPSAIAIDPNVIDWLFCTLADETVQLPENASVSPLVVSFVTKSDEVTVVVPS